MPTKRCRRCKIEKPIQAYQIPRHKLCAQCLTRGVVPPAVRAEREAQALLQAHEYALAKAQERADAIARGEDPWKPLLPTKPRTMEWDSYKDYMVDRARQIRAEKDARARASGEAKTPSFRTIKFCVRCKTHKHVSQFDNPRDRICLACYNPNNTTVV